MDPNNNEVERDFFFYVRTTLGIFGYWIIAILQTIFPFMIKRKSVDGEIVLITGAGQGLGQLLSIEFAKLNAIIVAFDINDKALNETKKLVEENGSKCFVYNVDVSSKENVYKAAERVKEEVGTVYMLINNAGVVSGKNFLDLKDEEIERSMNVNAMAHFWTVKAFLPGMCKRNHGHLVSISSLAGLVGANKLSDYCASKFAAAGFEESLRIELNTSGYDGVKSSVVCPWYINTGMFEGVRTLPMVPLLDPKYAASRIVDAVLKDQMVVIIPRLFYSMLFFKWLIPTMSGKCLIALLGADRSMDEFVGHSKRK